MKIFVTRIIPDRGLTLLKEHFPSCDIWSADMPPAREELLQRVRGVDGLLCLLTEKIDVELMDAAGPQLKVISSMSVGVDHIDVASVSTPGVLPTGIPRAVAAATSI